MKKYRDYLFDSDTREPGIYLDEDSPHGEFKHSDIIERVTRQGEHSVVVEVAWRKNYNYITWFFLKLKARLLRFWLSMSKDCVPALNITEKSVDLIVLNRSFVDFIRDEMVEVGTDA